ncbi:hypothetical protein ACFYL6_25475 [Micromonospora sp. NPDC007208]|uniref:hypothetical protein n=1 Tax=Micromonospora sp. NPDC007208 TaxID=3364236 RepID=UPI0036B986AF
MYAWQDAPVRPRLILLTVAVSCAAFHVAGVLTARPIWRYAEVLSIGLLLTYAMLSRSPSSRWALWAALTVALVDTVRTMPAAQDHDGYGVMMLVPDSGLDTPSAFESGLSLCWPSLTAVLVLLVAWRRGGWRRSAAAPAVVGGALITGYAVVRVVGTSRALAAQPPHATGVDVAETMVAVSTAVLPPLVLGFAALALTAVLAGHGRRLASIGAALLALMALPLMDACIAAVPMPLFAVSDYAMFAWDAITPTLSVPQPMSALTAAVELTAYLLLVVGLTDFPGPARASAAGA